MKSVFISLFLCFMMCTNTYAQVCTPVLRQVLTTPPNGTEAGFGVSSVIQGDWAYIGAPIEVVDGIDSGSVHIVHFDGIEWVDVGRVVPPDPQAGQYFGETVSVDEDTMMVGAVFDRDIGENAGAVYVFERVRGVWEFAQKLHASDGQATQAFGRVFVHGDTAVVGANARVFGDIPGAAYVFERTMAGWTETQKLVPSASHDGDLFGVSCMFYHDRMVIGSPYTRDFNTLYFGAVYLFQYQGGRWIETQKLQPDIVGVSNDFGIEVAIQSLEVFVGEPNEDGDGDAGRVHVYRLEDDVWVQTQELTPEHVEVRGFGSAVEVCDDRLMIGAPALPDFSLGEVELFTRRSDGWAWDSTIVNPAASGTLFGPRLALGGEVAMVLALNFETSNGEVYVYSLGCGGCDADLNADGVVDFGDVIAFLDAYNDGSTLADLTMDGELNFYDVSAFLVAYQGGCL